MNANKKGLSAQKFMKGLMAEVGHEVNGALTGRNKISSLAAGESGDTRKMIRTGATRLRIFKDE